MCCVGGRQEAQKQYLERDLSEGLLCAVINNNTRCYNESTEFADHLDDALAAPYKVRHKGLDICRCNASEALFKIQARGSCRAARLFCSRTRSSVCAHGKLLCERCSTDTK